MSLRTTTELIREVQVARLCDPIRAAIAEVELDRRIGTLDGAEHELDDLNVSLDLLSAEG